MMACGHCEDGYLRAENRCCDCPRGRERAGVLARQYGDEERASLHKQQASRALLDPRVIALVEDLVKARR